MNLNAIELRAVSALQTEIAKLSPAAQAEIAKGLSWAARHITWALPAAAAVGLIVGIWLGAKL